MTDQTLQRAKLRNDLIAKWVITVIGVGTIFAVLAIVVVVIMEIVPLFYGADLVPRSRIHHGNSTILASQAPWPEKAWSLESSGKVVVHDLILKQVESTFPLRPEASANIVQAEWGLDSTTTLTWDDQLVTRVDLGFKPVFDQQSRRTIVLKTQSPITHTYKSPQPLRFALSRHDKGTTTFLGLTLDGRVVGQRIAQEEDFLGNINAETKDLSFPLDRVSFLDCNSPGKTAFTLTEEGELVFWNLASGLQEQGRVRIELEGRKVTDLSSMIGTDEVALAYSTGEVEVITLASPDGKKLAPTRIHRAQVSSSAIVALQSSPRDRTLFMKNLKGELIAWYTTNHRVLYEQSIELENWGFAVATRGKGVTLWSDRGDLQVADWESPHPEGGWRAFFQMIWYSGYAKPDYVWQSSSGDDEFEPKISLVPLIFGTIKGAVYAMMFSVPLAVLAALYTSVFAGTTIKGIIKPVVEMMSAIPSVVVGFLGALWLAPLIDEHLLTLALAMPLAFLLLLFLPMIVGKTSGKDPLLNRPQLILMLATVVIFASGYASSFLADFLEGMGAFDGDFRTWLLQGYLAGNYDMRNSMIISITLGFAVIPIIYSISEDALSSVPKGLTSASLALGATPWQTAWRVVLPTASPGIFAATTLGMGRAVGETMIVLMATGNTAIMDVNIFEGFRALSANIAVEMPEAPQGGTLYRTLFLSAGVLLVFTSALNTITEMVRHRLAKNYSKL